MDSLWRCWRLRRRAPTMYWMNGHLGMEVWGSAIAGRVATWKCQYGTSTIAGRIVRSPCAWGSMGRKSKPVPVLGATVGWLGTCLGGGGNCESPLPARGETPALSPSLFEEE